jgi:hypothetical protein
VRNFQWAVREGGLYTFSRGVSIGIHGIHMNDGVEYGRAKQSWSAPQVASVGSCVYNDTLLMIFEAEARRRFSEFHMMDLQIRRSVLEKCGAPDSGCVILRAGNLAGFRSKPVDFF